MTQHPMPKGFRVLRLLAVIAAIFSVLLFFISSAKFLAICTFIFYILCITAIDKKNKILYTILTTLLCILVLISIGLFISNLSVITACRLIIEIYIISYLVKHRRYFSL
ncbi:MAG: hypothetical protein V4576_03640 [Patescibacteria group bacterium]